MLNFFFTYNSEYESYEPTIAGYTALCILMLLILLTCVFITGKKQKKINTTELTFCSISLALAFVTGTFIKLFRMPMGGSVTLCSMLFITLIGYWYGLRVGLMTAFAYGLLQFVTNPWIISVPQVFFDYIFAYGSLGLSGIFRNSKHGILKGYLTGVFGRFVFSFLSGIIFFAAASAAAGAEYGLNLPGYSAVCNGAYLGAEAAITVAVIMIPPVNKALKYVKVMALGNRQ